MPDENNFLHEFFGTDGTKRLPAHASAAAETDGGAQSAIFPPADYGGKLRLCIKVAEIFAANENDGAEETLCAAADALQTKLDNKRLLLPCDCEKELPAKGRANICLAGAIFFIMTGGKYPDEVWTDAAKPRADGAYARMNAALNALQSDGDLPRPAAENIRRMGEEIKFSLKKRDVEKLAGGGENAGEVKIYEMLWDALAFKYPNYRPKIWISCLEEYLGKSHRARVKTSAAGDGVEIYAVSHEGMLQKPGHISCEDYSSCCTFDGRDGAWLAVCNDGVGSCIDSALGSQKAAEALKNVISAKIEQLTEAARKSKRFRRRYKSQTPAINWVEFAIYMRNSLAGDLYAEWEKLIRASGEYANYGGAGTEAFATTMQFAFGCPDYVLCGAVGDGVFFVKKSERITDRIAVGGFDVNDGVSGVTQTEVLTLAHLKTNPHALQMRFFDADEVDCILIASDGADSLFGNMKNKLDFCYELYETADPSERADKADAAAMRCADYNETQCGKGDDCSIVFALMTHGERENTDEVKDD